MVKAQTTGQHGSVTIRSGQIVLEVEKFTSSIV